LATEQELSDFLKSVEKRAFKRSLLPRARRGSGAGHRAGQHDEAGRALRRQAAGELPMLFQRILSNCTLDWFRRQKTRNALFSNMRDFESGEEGDFDLLETYSEPRKAPKHGKFRRFPAAGADLA
jgi:RNA polymerase sigma-70 factor (ECF subfamily)